MTDASPKSQGSSTPVKADLTQNLADNFSRIIRDWLLPEEMTHVLIRNRTNSPNVCATHDFCDANMAMEEAFVYVTGRVPNLRSEADAAAWNVAWLRAKNAEFPRTMELIQTAEGGRAYAFRIQDMCIHNPRLCGRFEVDPIEHYGLRPEEICALDAANALLNEPANSGMQTDRCAESTNRTSMSSTTIAELRELYVNLQEWHSGGNCVALRHPCDDGGYLLITDSGGLQIPADDPIEVYVGRYAANGDTVEEARSILIGEAQAWIDAALSRARNPENIADYFSKKLGAAPSDESLRQLPLASSCGQDCAQAIDLAAGLLEHVRAAFGSNPHGHPFYQAEEQLIDVARRVIEVYWRG